MTDWNNEALPVLEAIARVLEGKGSGVNPFADQYEVNAELGRPAGDARTDRTLYDLCRTGYIDSLGTTDQQLAPLDLQLAEKGLQVTSGWPGAEPPAEALLAAIAARIETTNSDEERSRLQRAYDALYALSREVLSDVLANLITGRV